MMCFSWLSKSRPNDAHAVGWITFQIGLIFLASSAFISGIFLIISLVLGSRRRDLLFWNDPWNWPLLLSAIIMIFGCFNAYSGWLAWVGLCNWLPFFWAFWGLQPYLKTNISRRRSALLLLIGTLPVVVTGLGQILWGWEGPWQLFGGLIVWFMSPNGNPNGRLSGLFDYANIAGAWLALVWPFSLAVLIQHGINRIQRSLLLSLSIAIVTALILTDSRNAWGSLVLAIPFVVGPASWFWLLPILFLLLMPVILAVLPGIHSDWQFWARNVVPEEIWARLNDMRYTEERTLASTRLSQWGEAFNLLVERPWLGWGAAAFSILYPLRTGKWHGHAHNLPLELAVSHGLLAAFLIVGMVLALLITSLRRGVLNNTQIRKDESLRLIIFDRAWWTSSFILVVLHGTDMPFFDSRLNIAGWILLAGLRCIIISPKKIYSLF